MNSLELVNHLMKKEGQEIFQKRLEKIWGKVWDKHDQKSYQQFRIYKTTDKIKVIESAGIDFNNKSVLDLGCGDGTTLKYLMRCMGIKDGTGVDISPHAIGQIKKGTKENGLQFMVGDHRDLSSFESNKFDIVLSWGVIEHFDEYLLALAEAYRVLKPGAHLILIQPHFLSFGVLQEYYLRLVGKWRFGKQKDWSFLFYRKILKGTGFKDINSFTRPPYFDMKYTRFFDSIGKKVFSNWGHYLYLICQK